MTTLDARARSAAHSIHAGLAEFTPAASFDVVVVRQARWRTMRAGFAGAAAAALVVIAGIAVTPSPAPEVAETPTTIVEPTVPTPEVVPPIVVETTEAPAPTTTSTTTTTTAAPETTTTVAPDTTPPPLTITTPKEGERFEVDVIEFAGTTEPGATVFAGQYEAPVDDSGRWSIMLVLSPGANGASFTATDPAGNQTVARVTVHYDVPAPTTTTTKPPEEVEFTAHNVYGVCEEDPPYDVYWGTAPPGTPIYVESEYGSGSTVANEGGEWEIKVFFPEAPPEKEFTVKVKDYKGNKFYFTMKHLI